MAQQHVHLFLRRRSILDGAVVIAQSEAKSTRTIHVVLPLPDGGLASDTQYSVNITSLLSNGVVISKEVAFRTGLLVRSDWRAAWITGGFSRNLLRTEFSLASPLNGSIATLYVTGIG